MDQWVWIIAAGIMQIPLIEEAKRRGFKVMVSDGNPLAEGTRINMIPLVDVMLVLLIIFMITAPLIAHKIKIDLPQASTVLLEEKPDTIVIALMADGRMFLNDVPIERTALLTRLSTEAQRKPQPELHLHVDRITQFQLLATVMADAQNAGMVKVGIATGPIKGADTH